MYRQALREALLIVLAAAVAGVLYSAIAKRGLFGSPVAETGNTLTRKHDVPTLVKLEGARQLFETQQALFIDSRHEFDFRLGHIRGALNMPVAEFEKRDSLLTRIPSDTLIVVYCDGAECNSSFELAGKLYVRGFKNVRIFFGGWQDWTTNNLPSTRDTK